MKSSEGKVLNLFRKLGLTALSEKRQEEPLVMKGRGLLRPKKSQLDVENGLEDTGRGKGKLG